MIYLLYFIPI